MSEKIKIKYWWSDDKKWFCIIANDGVNESTVSLTPEEASLLAMNALPAKTERAAVVEDAPIACADCQNTGWCHAQNKCVLTGSALVPPLTEEG